MAKIKSWRAWVHGLIGALYGGAVTAGLTYLTTQLAGLDLKPRQFFLTIGIAAVVQGFLYLKDSPLPFNDETETPTIPPTP